MAFHTVLASSYPGEPCASTFPCRPDFSALIEAASTVVIPSALKVLSLKESILVLLGRRRVRNSGAYVDDATFRREVSGLPPLAFVIFPTFRPNTCRAKYSFRTFFICKRNRNVSTSHFPGGLRGTRTAGF